MRLNELLSTALLLAGVSAQGGRMNLTALLGSNNQLSGLVTLLGAYPNIATSLASAENVTLLAPNNAAIKALMNSGALNGASESLVAAVLNYHVLPGMIYSSAITATPVFAPTLLNDTTYANVTGGQVVEAQVVGQNVIFTSGLKAQSTVVQADLNYTGGVVHIIDTVLTIPLDASETAIDAGLTAFAGALEAANFIPLIDITPDTTIFAPSNEAFAAIGSALANATIADLTAILSYHVVNGTVAYSSLLSNETVPALGGNGDKLTITVVDGAVFVNSARVINADILVGGGVVHVIDSVLNVFNQTKANPAAKSPVPVYSGATSGPIAALTTGLPAATTTVSALVATTNQVAAGPSSAAAGGTGGSGGTSSSASSGIAAVQTGMVGAAALFGGAALVANW